MMMDESLFLSSDDIIDCDNDIVKDFAESAVGKDANGPIEIAIKLYYAVRDRIFYDPYLISRRPEDYRASATIQRGRGYCVQKAVLLCALGRVYQIPSRLGFATVKNHLASAQLIEFIGSNLFVYHGYTDFFLNDKWVKATPAFNASLCKRHHVAPLEFNGLEDSIFQAYNEDKKQYMEYVEYYGTHHTLPMDDMIEKWRELCGSQQVDRWFQYLENPELMPRKNFNKEKPLIS